VEDTTDPVIISGPRGRAFAALHDALLAIGAERSPEPLLERLVATARDLVGARYAALGIPDGEGGFARFITAGIGEEEMARIGPLPRVHGMLGAMLDDTDPTRLDDLTADPRFEWWPAAHPVMRSFLGVPVRAGGDVVAAFYLTDKRGAARFGDDDVEIISVLAAHGAIAIENARLWERAREAVTLAERTRVARELHDAMTQTLFSLQLTATSAAAELDADPDAAREHLGTVSALARSLGTELRALIVDLRPPEVDADGLVGALRKHLALLDRVHAPRVALVAHAEPDLDDLAARALFRIAQEAVHNALRHADAAEVTVELRVTDAEAALTVTDDGTGFDPTDPRVRATRLGLTSMRARAQAVGGRLRITSTPGEGTRVRATIPAVVRRD
jgi:signal transduction histidine kinase